jgi:hypothetical protein
MANLNGRNIGLSYQGILNLETINTPLSSTVQNVSDGTGQNSPLRLGTDSVRITGGNLFVDSNLFNAGFIEAGRLISTTTATASTPPVSITGGWFSSGSATTTKPQLLIEPTGTTSNAWSTSGTGLGINAASTFNGKLIEAQKDGVSKFYVSVGGDVVLPGYVYANVLAAGGGNVVIRASAGGIMAIYNGPENDFNRLQFGGTTSLYPALKRSTTNLEFKLADDSAFTGFTASASTITATSLSTTSTSYLTLINTTEATASIRQNSPALSLIGSGYNGSAGVATGFKIYSNIFSATSYELKFTTAGDADVLIVGTTSLTMIGSINGTSINATGNGASATPRIYGSGTWFTGGGATNTKPYLLIEPSGTTTNTWSANGTGIGINAPSGFTGNIFSALVNGSASIRINNSADILLGTGGPRLQAVDPTSIGSSGSLTGAGLASSTGNNTGHGFIIYAPSLNATSGSLGALKVVSTFAPTVTGSGSYSVVNIGYTVNATAAQTGTVTGIYARATQTDLNGATHNLIDLGVGSTSIFSVSNVGVPNFNQTPAGSAGGNSGQHLVIKVGTTTYKIALLNN